MSTAAATAPVVDLDGVTFWLPDAQALLLGVRLRQQAPASDEQLAFGYRRGGWSLRLVRPPVDRLEYLVELELPNGRRETIPDPTNAVRVAGAFGEKSVIEFPGYRSPGWLANSAAIVPMTRTPVAVPSRQLGATFHAEVLAPESLANTAQAPLVMVNDGPEYAHLASFVRYVGAMIAADRIPPVRIALLEPGDRNRWYAVNPAYARSLATEVIPVLSHLAPSKHRIAVGASLGALAMLHAHRLYPQLFAALFLQSGSFFTAELDPQESRFPRYRAVTRFVTDLCRAVTDPAPVPTALTFGMIEENAANNRAMATTLDRLGYPVRLHECRDLHNYTAWRDALHPGLTELIRGVAS